MPRDWTDVFITGDGARIAATSAGEEPGAQGEAGTERRGFFRRLRENLSKTRQALGAEIQATLFEGELDSATWERLEEALIMADVGARTTAEVVSQLEIEAESGSLEGGEALTNRLTELLADRARPGEGRIDLTHDPTVIMVAGVNGTGKTTTIGKLAQKLREHDHSVLLAAADTFRAAAEEQLEIWAGRAGADFVGSERGGDPAAVAYDAIEAATARGRGVVIVDTAGRLHTQTNLMEELAKVRRVIERRLHGAPHETLLVVDATTGQNGLQQARLFGEAVAVTGVALTKLDGSAKGGVALAIAHELGLPVKLVGVGEGLDDLRPFDARDYANALLT
jgi:fused signal recognition particle receptor